MNSVHLVIPLPDIIKATKLRLARERDILNDLVSSSDPEKHELAVSMIQQAVNGHHADAESNAIKVVMRSQNVVKLLTMLFSNSKVSMADCCNSLSWDMSNDHLAVIKLLLGHFGKTREDAVEKILECVPMKNRDLVKHLISCRNDTKERLIRLEKLLSYYFVLSDPPMVAFVVSEGANINACVNDENKYPLHLACENNKAQTVKLLLQLGADVNVVDKSGKTAFQVIFKYENASGFLDIATLLIKQFVWSINASNAINEEDLSIIQKRSHLQKLYESCFDELDRMKTIEVFDGIPFLWFFSKSRYELALRLKNPEICNQVRRNILNLKPDVFPIFKVDIATKFGIAKQISKVVDSRERELENVFKGIFPSLVVHKIVRFSLDLVNVEKEHLLKRFL